MHSDLTDILSNNREPVSDRQLMDYLNGTLTDAERHELEKAMAAGTMEEDALEGLQMVGSQHKLAQYQAEINQSLHEKLRQKKQGRRHKQPPQLQWLLLVTVAVIAMAFLVWFIIRLMHREG